MDYDEEITLEELIRINDEEMYFDEVIKPKLENRKDVKDINGKGYK